eukprot:g26218.t1
MVFVEMMMGKGAAAAGMGMVKMASMGGSGTATAATWLGPTHDLLRGVTDLAPPEKVSGVLSGFTMLTDSLTQSLQGAATELSQVSPASIAGAAAFVGTLGGLHSFGILKVPAWLCGEEDQDQNQREVNGFNCSIRPSIAMICLSDALTSAAIFSSIGVPLDVPWGKSTSENLCCGNAGVARHCQAFGQSASRGGIMAEMMATAGAFCWLSFGTHLMSISHNAGQNAPLLFWNTFIQCTAAWSCLTFAMLTLIVSTVLTLSMGQKQ